MQPTHGLPLPAQYAGRSQSGPRNLGSQSGSVPPSSHSEQSTPTAAEPLTSRDIAQVREIAHGIFEQDPQLGIDFVLA